MGKHSVFPTFTSIFMMLSVCTTLWIEQTIFITVKFDIMKQINTPYYNISNIEVLASKIIITITTKIIKIIKLPREKIQKINKKANKNKD